MIVFIPGLFIADVVLRMKNQSHYVKNDTGFHRPPNKRYEVDVQDKPEKAGTFQNVRPGYPDIKCILSTAALQLTT